MEKEELNSWREFEEKLVELESMRANLCKQSSFDVPPLLFRGQPNETWELRSTLERYTNAEVPAKDYIEVVKKALPQIETYTGKRWNMDIGRFNEWEQRKTWYFFKSFPDPEYLIYLRHHGFPSPLLDWTKSPFVAAYFAFAKISHCVKKIAIYAYIESVDGRKTLIGSDPVISSLPADVPSHKRHFVQQSAYTICAKKTKSGVIFASHESAFSKAFRGENLRWKFTLPISERIKTLKKLDQMNINSLSLFDNEEGLMETIALRKFYLERDDL